MKGFISNFINALKRPKRKSEPKTVPATKGPRRVSDIGPIKEFEALRLKAYMPTPNDRWTIGWGHTSTARPGMVITEDQAEELLKDDLTWVYRVIEDHTVMPLTQPQYDALVSLIFNIGGNAFAGSTVKRRINEGRYAEAADAFLMWNKQRNRKTGKLEPLRGLTRRRQHERTLFLKGTQ